MRGFGEPLKRTPPADAALQQNAQSCFSSPRSPPYAKSPETFAHDNDSGSICVAREISYPGLCQRCTLTYGCYGRALQPRVPHRLCTQGHVGDAEWCARCLSYRIAETPRCTANSLWSILHFNDTPHGRTVDRCSRDGGSTLGPQAAQNSLNPQTTAPDGRWRLEAM